MKCEHGLTIKECYVCMSPKYGEHDTKQERVAKPQGKKHMSIEAMKQAIEALECLFGIPEQFTGKGGGDVAVWTLGGSYRAQQAIPVLRQAIDQAEKQEPVAFAAEIVADFNGTLSTRWADWWTPNEGDKLYTTPQPQEFVCSTGLCHFTLTQTNVGIGERGMEAYEAAKKRGWVGVSDERLMEMPKQEPVAWMDGYRNIYSLEEKAAGCEDAVIPLVPAIQHWSDCAVHNEPAYPKGDCDCGGYTTPQPQREWVGLTPADFDWLEQVFANKVSNNFVFADIVCVISAKLKEKNGGNT